MLKLNNELKLIPIFLFKGLIYLYVISFLSKTDYGLYAFLIVMSYNITRFLDFGTTEGIIAHEIKKRIFK